MKRCVVCLGAVNLDLLFEVSDLEGFLAAWGTDLSRGGEEALSPDKEKRLQDLLPRFAKPSGRTGGGQAANAAYALARLDVPVVLLGLVGADDDGAYLQESLAGVNLDHLVTKGQSGRAYVLVDPDGERTILLAPHTNDRLSEDDIPLEVVADAAFVHVTSLAGDGPLEVQRRVLQRLAGNLRVCFDPGELYARRGREALTDILDQTETLLVTEKEWHLLGGTLRGHIDWAPPVVLVKRGAKGSRLLTPVRYLDFPPYEPEGLVDTVGAGDVFAAGYIAGLFQGLNLPQAVRLASALAAFSLRGPGRESYPDRRVMDAIVSSLR
ncbi:MAG: carbohydrate kinase family protein [Thermodesulfobacteriota bacterium]